MEDSKILHILKELPAWVILAPIFSVLMTMIYFGNFSDPSTLTFMQRITDGTLGALLLSLNTRRNNATTVNADTVQTPAVNTNTIKDSTFNTETVQTDSEENEKS